MSGDYTRFTFKPRNNYGGVLMQQGRVTLDADWNEGVEALDRRWRAETMDIVGRAVVMRTDLDTDGVPSAFRILPSGASFTIGRGRAYVDGLLAENHGVAPFAFDVPLNEVRGTLPCTYETQPYYPLPPAMPTTGTHVVYVDVWEREVTALEDPAIVEKAVGVDTATRLQTVWQVKLLAVPAGSTCATDLSGIPAWVSATRPSGGRLTSGSIPGSLSTDPCVIAAAGGYRGTENRLYRVEIHAAGAAGVAQFKWSRDNASVVSAVTGLDATQNVITVSRIGRDERLRFRNGDWVEITNDIRELHGVAGEVRQLVADPDEVTLQLRFGGAALPLGAPTVGSPYTFDSANPETARTRVKLWHQQGIVRDSGGGIVTNLLPGSSGVIPVPASAATAVILEDGVTVSFSLDAAGGQFKVGDYWVFEARTIDGSVGQLNAAPPRGIHHHYARLAVFTLPATVTDCRTVWPPDGGCCLVVRPGQSIQNAINSLPPAGGCVCLKAGRHVIPAPIVIHRPNVVLHGDSPGAIVEFGPSGALDIGGSANAVVVHDIQFTLNGVGAAPPVAMAGAARVRIERCQFRAAGEDTSPPVGILVERCRNVELIDNVIGTFTYGILVSAHAGTFSAIGNTVAGIFRRIPFAGAVVMMPLGVTGIRVETGTTAAPLTCRIEDNHLVDFLTGIELGLRASGSTICRNDITRRFEGPIVFQDGDVPGSITAMRAYLERLEYGIDCGAPDCLIEGNVIPLPTRLGGIRISAPGSRVRANVLTAADIGERRLQACGIYCAGVPRVGDVGAFRCDVTDNRLEGPQLGFALSRVEGVRVYGNRLLSGLTQCWRGILVDSSTDTLLESNDLTGTQIGISLLGSSDRNRVIGNSITNGLFGMTAAAQGDLEIRGNSVRGAQYYGMFVVARRGYHNITDNRVANCAWQFYEAGDTTFPTAAIAVIGVDVVIAREDLHVSITNCTVTDTGIAPTGETASVAVVGIWVWTGTCEVSGCEVGYSERARLNASLEHRALRLKGTLYSRINDTEFNRGGATVLGNYFRGPGRHHLVEVEREILSEGDNFIVEYRFEQMAYSNNRSDHIPGDDGAASVLLHARNVVAMGNLIKVSERIPGLRVVTTRFTPRAVTLMGNISTGNLVVPATPRTRPLPVTGTNFTS